MKRLTPASFSLALRAHELHRRCFADARLLQQWEDQVARVKVRPRTNLPHVLVHLGMSQHPEVLRLTALGSPSGSVMLQRLFTTLISAPSTMPALSNSQIRLQHWQAAHAKEVSRAAWTRPSPGAAQTQEAQTMDR